MELLKEIDINKWQAKEEVDPWCQSQYLNLLWSLSHIKEAYENFRETMDEEQSQRMSAVISRRSKSFEALKGVMEYRGIDYRYIYVEGNNIATTTTIDSKVGTSLGSFCAIEFVLAIHRRNLFTSLSDIVTGPFDIVTLCHTIVDNTEVEIELLKSLSSPTERDAAVVKFGGFSNV